MSLFSVEKSLTNKCINLDAADLNLAALIVSILHCYMADSCGDLIASHSGKQDNHFSQFISNLPIHGNMFSKNVY